MIKKATQRAATMTGKLLAFSRNQIAQPTAVSLNSVIQDMTELLPRLIGEDVEFISRLAPDLQHIHADLSQVEQIIMNLAVNARDAMPEGGKLIIETANVVLADQYVRTHMEVEAGDYVMLAVSDTGIGMGEDIQSRCFEPFFTTKAPGKGTGLGLSTVYGIVRQNGGYIMVYSEPGEGATFKIYLPAHQEGGEVSDEKPTIPTANLYGTENILLVEDEADLRDLMVQFLERFGYSVIAAPNGSDALKLCEYLNGPLHLLLTDLIMPKMGGRVVADRLCQKYSELKVLFMSGYTSDAIQHKGMLDPEMDFISKPFRLSELAAKIREVLDR